MMDQKPSKNNSKTEKESPVKIKIWDGDTV